MDFSGIKRRTVDDKGRLVLPAELREQLGAECMVSKGFEHALHIWPLDGYEAESEEIKKHKITNRKVRMLWRNHFGAERTAFDPQGRITIPKELRDYAGIAAGGNVVVSGFGNRIELWDADRYDRVIAEHDQYFADLDEGSFEAGE